MTTTDRLLSIHPRTTGGFLACFWRWDGGAWLQERPIAMPTIHAARSHRGAGAIELPPNPDFAIEIWAIRGES